MHFVLDEYFPDNIVVILHLAGILSAVFGILGPVYFKVLFAAPEVNETVLIDIAYCVSSVSVIHETAKIHGAVCGDRSDQGI